MTPAGAELELVLDTLADITVDSDGKGLSQARVVRTPSRRPSWPARVGPDFLGVASITGRTWPSRLPMSSSPPWPRRPRHPAWSGGDRAEHRRPGRDLRAVRHPGPSLAGREEVILGRGSFKEPSPLSGQRLEGGRTTTTCMPPVGAERGWPAVTREQLEARSAPHGAVLAGALRPPRRGSSAWPAVPRPRRLWDLRSRAVRLMTGPGEPP